MIDIAAQSAFVFMLSFCYTAALAALHVSSAIAAFAAFVRHRVTTHTTATAADGRFRMAVVAGGGCAMGSVRTWWRLCYSGRWPLSDSGVRRFGSAIVLFLSCRSSRVAVVQWGGISSGKGFRFLTFLKPCSACT